MKKVILLILVLFTASCNLSRYHTPVTIKELLPVGSTLQLTQTLEIPEDRLFIYIANGKVMPLKNYNTVDIYQPYCMFRLYKAAAQPRQVMPDQFEITKIVEWEAYYGDLNTQKFTNAVSNKGEFIKVSAVNYDDGGSRTVMYATIMSVRSEKQPEVKELVCGHWDDQAIVEPLTLQELKTALGNLIRIAIKPNGVI